MSTLSEKDESSTEQPCSLNRTTLRGTGVAARLHESAFLADPRASLGHHHYRMDDTGVSGWVCKEWDNFEDVVPSQQHSLCAAHRSHEQRRGRLGYVPTWTTSRLPYGCAAVKTLGVGSSERSDPTSLPNPPKRGPHRSSAALGVPLMDTPLGRSRARLRRRINSPLPHSSECRARVSENRNVWIHHSLEHGTGRLCLFCAALSMRRSNTP